MGVELHRWRDRELRSCCCSPAAATPSAWCGGQCCSGWGASWSDNHSVFFSSESCTTLKRGAQRWALWVRLDVSAPVPSIPTLTSIPVAPALQPWPFCSFNCYVVFATFSLGPSCPCYCQMSTRLWGMSNRLLVPKTSFCQYYSTAISVSWVLFHGPTCKTESLALLTKFCDKFEPVGWGLLL